ncbi:MAG TPA: response regulator transcription factor [Candidatus Acidoferrum sp.]|nr:response regulator transcription factor [Candidatus Acidoferrum sp.]
MNILVVEDEAELASALVRGLEEEEFRVQLCGNGKAALQRAEAGNFDLILLDVMLPDLSGFQVVEQMRLRSRETLVLMLTARDSLADVVRGLDCGADDYLTKPFSFIELLSRVRALGRRCGVKPRHVLEAGELVLDVAAQRAFRAGVPLNLSLTEFRLLEVLARNKGQVVPRQAIIADVWGSRRDVEENTLDAYVRLLRKKIERDSQSRLIKTHRGIGYSMGLSVIG